jgi:uncharacterized protein YlzI (FlbEa/FlbD family)
MFIKLTRHDGEKILVNPAHIMLIGVEQENTVIEMPDDCSFMVQETPKEIIEKIKCKH